MGGRVGISRSAENQAQGIAPHQTNIVSSLQSNRVALVLVIILDGRRVPYSLTLSSKSHVDMLHDDKLSAIVWERFRKCTVQVGLKICSPLPSHASCIMMIDGIHAGFPGAASVYYYCHGIPQKYDPEYNPVGCSMYSTYRRVSY